MRLLTLFTIIAGTAQAAPLMGSTASFTTTQVCAANKCEHSATFPLTGTLKLFTYTISSENTENPNEFRIVRNGQQIVSTAYRTGGQDWVFGPGSEGARQLASLIDATTGVRPSTAWIDKMQCKDIRTGQYGINRYKAGAKAYTVTCVINSGQGFVYFDVSIY